MGDITPWEDDIDGLKDLRSSYRALVGAILGHTFVGREGHDIAIADFRESNDRAVPVLDLIVKLQNDQREESQ